MVQKMLHILFRLLQKVCRPELALLFYSSSTAKHLLVLVAIFKLKLEPGREGRL